MKYKSGPLATENKIKGNYENIKNCITVSCSSGWIDCM